MIKSATHTQTAWMVLALYCAENLQVVCLPFPIWKPKQMTAGLHDLSADRSKPLRYPGPKGRSPPDSSSWLTADFGYTV